MLSRFLVASFGLVAIVGSVSEARAQSKNAIGVMIVTPSLLGFDWDVSSKLAIRPDFSFSRTSGDFSSWTATVGLSTPVYLRDWDGVHLYLSPRVSHSLNRIRSSSASGSNTATVSSVGGSFGAQYSLGVRFSIFAEGGVVYTHTRQVGTFVNDNLSNRTALGAIVYF